MSGFKKHAAGIGFFVVTCVSWLVTACSQPVTTPTAIELPKEDFSMPEAGTTTTETPTVTSPVTTETPTTTTALPPIPPIIENTVPPPTENTAPPAESPPVVSSVRDIDIAAYRLNIVGLVNNQESITYDQIQAYPAVTQTTEIICPDVEDEWDDWTGVPVSALLKEAGLAPGASEVVFTGIDGYHIQLPLETVLENGVFLAYKMNGETLSPERGYPLRLVVNGMLGNYWMRWITKIEIKQALVSFSNATAIIQNLRTNIPPAGNKLCACLLRLGAPFKL